MRAGTEQSRAGKHSGEGDGHNGVDLFERDRSVRATDSRSAAPVKTGPSRSPRGRCQREAFGRRLEPSRRRQARE